MEQITAKMSSLVSGATTKQVETTQLPTGVPGKPYVISQQDGEILYIPLSKSATRLLLTGKETNNDFVVVSSSGSQSDPIGFHYHREAHDVFLCLKGSVNVWANDQARTLTAGDFASVPPLAIHQYQILGPHSDMVGLIVPGGWEEFFRSIGEPYDGPMWPMDDTRNVFEVLIPKLKAAAEKHDMVPLPQHKQFAPQEWTGEENKLPGKLEPYFLKNATGPAYDVGGTVCRPLATIKETDGRFSMGSVELSSQHHQHSIFAKENSSLRFDKAQHAFQVMTGSVEFQLDSYAPSKIHAGEMIYVPKGTAFRYQATSRFSKMYVFASGPSIVEVLCKLGKEHKTTILPEKAEDSDTAALEALQPELGFTSW